MRNLRSVTFSKEQLASFDPWTFCEAMLNADLTFDHIGCPFKITQPWDRVENADGSITYRQWDSEKSS